MSESDSTNLIHHPHLNADVYRTNSSEAENAPHYDYINIFTDGVAMLGCSNLTGRRWNGTVKIAESVSDLQSPMNAKLSSIQLESGTAAGTFLYSNSKVLLCDDSGSISIWTRSEGAWGVWTVQECVYEHHDFITALTCLEPDKTYVTVAADGNAKVWDLTDLLCTQNYLGAHYGMINDVTVRPNSTKHFLTSAMDMTAVLWDIGSEKSVEDVHVGDCGVRCAEWLDDNSLVLGDEGGRLWLADVRAPRKSVELLTFPAPVHRLLANQNGKHVAVCCDNRIVSVVEAREGAPVVYEDRTAHDNYVRGLAWDHSSPALLHTCAWDSTVATHKPLLDREKREKECDE